jgi:hypothetical protein
MPIVTFDQWVEAVFEHPLRKPEWYWDSDFDEYWDALGLNARRCTPARGPRSGGQVLCRRITGQVPIGESTLGAAFTEPCTIPSHDWLRHRRGRTRALADSGLRGGGGQFGDQEFHDGVGVVGSAFEAVVGGLQGLQALEEAGLGDFAGGLQGELGLFGAHG